MTCQRRTQSSALGNHQQFPLKSSVCKENKENERHVTISSQTVSRPVLLSRFRLQKSFYFDIRMVDEIV